jgi:hypothetical protein
MESSLAVSLLVLLAALGVVATEQQEGSSSSVDVEAILRNQVAVKVYFRNDTRRIFTSSSKIAAFSGHYAFDAGDGVTPAMAVKRRLVSIEPANHTVIIYVFLFRRDVVAQVVADFRARGPSDTFFYSAGVLHLDYYVRVPSDFSKFSQSADLGVVEYNAVKWALGPFVVIPILVAFECIAMSLCRGRPAVTIGGEDKSYLARRRARREMKRQAAAGPTPPPVVVVHSPPKRTVEPSPPLDQYDAFRLGAGISTAFSNTSTPPFGYVSPAGDASPVPTAYSPEQSLPPPRGYPLQPSPPLCSPPRHVV